VGSLETLDSAAVEAALEWIAGRFGPLTTSVKQDWEEILGYLYPGELKPVIERWHGTPSPHAVLDYIMTNRPPKESPKSGSKPDHDYVMGIIQKARADLG
jgi:hypothetical protein